MPNVLNMVRLHIFLPVKLSKSLAKIAKDMGVPKSELARRAIEEYVKTNTP